MANDHITSDMVESTEFPYLANKYNVQGVPHTIINEKGNIVGAQPDMEFVRAILKASADDSASH